TLRAPFSMIKGIPSSFVISLIKERIENGEYTDVFDFAARCMKYGLNIPTLVKLITAGCFDSMVPSRSSLRATVYSIMSYAEMFGDSEQGPSLLSIGLSKPKIVEAEDNLKEDLRGELETLGMTISKSLFTLYKDALNGVSYTPLSDIDDVNGVFETVALVRSIKTIITKAGKQLAFLDVYDDVDERSFVMWAETYTESYMHLKVDNLIKIAGRKDRKKEDSFVALNVVGLGE
ncbi:MAG: hypothetical protein MJ238_07175, partial [Bacilli bacterium]|nr:hypothetical protein [Bacilli bacterium]